MDDFNAMPLPALFEHLVDDQHLKHIIALAFAEDLGDRGDVTSQVLIEPDRASSAGLVARGNGIVAGLPLIPHLISHFDAEVEVDFFTHDGTTCEPDQVLARLLGPLRSILAIERTMLNFLGRLCGVATLTNEYAAAVAGTNALVYDTRKTTPGLRTLEKYAVRCGGGQLHRIGLYDAVLIKDNHISHLPLERLAGALEEASAAARTDREIRFFEVEVDTLEQMRAVLSVPSGCVDIILLDNMSILELSEAVALRDALAPTIQLEASGGVNLQSIRAIAETGVDRISVGALTHSPPNFDLGLDIA